MAVALARGAFLGEMFEELLRVVSEAKHKAKRFKSQLEELEFSLKLYVWVIRKIDKYNEELDLPKKEKPCLMEIMKEGEQLVHKCSKVKWNYMKKIYYAVKLLQLNSTIDRFYRFEIQAQNNIYQKEILLCIRDICGKFNENTIFRPCSVPDPPESTPGLDVPLVDLKKELLRDGMRVIVVSAPQGTGKTTLVEKLCKDEQVEGKFKDNIFFVMATKLPNVKDIVKRIFQHNGKYLHKFKTDEQAVNALERLLKERESEPILLVLDDVRTGSESMVQKFKFQLPNYKILVTSRCVFPEFGSGYNLQPLNDEDALALFYSSAIPEDGDSYIPDQNLLNKILSICKGSPLALTEVGRSLRGEPGIIWKVAVEKWTQDATLLYSKIFSES